MKLVLIDNYDSFTYTIKHYLEVLQVEVEVIKHLDCRLLTLEKLKPHAIILSPGPGNPNQAGFTLSIIQQYYQYFPFLGICLGHQCLVQAFGGTIIPASQVMHGKISDIFHTAQGLLTCLPTPFKATRYHSLIAALDSMPEALSITAWTYDKNGKKVVMACQHTSYPLFGIQYHPEAILTEHGLAVFKNFLSSI